MLNKLYFFNYNLIIKSKNIKMFLEKYNTKHSSA